MPRSLNKSYPLRLAVCGTGERVENHYAPILRGLNRELQWVGVWGRTPDRVRAVSDHFSVSGFTDLDRMIRDTDPHILLLCVKADANGSLGHRLTEYKRALLLETPIANELSWADRIVRAGEENKFPVEVAEQFHRRPVEETKRMLIQKGLFGRIFMASNDFVGHGYHGVSLIRSYIGFEQDVVKVTALGARFPIQVYWGPGKVPPPQEEWQTALMEFDNGALGLFMFTNISYESSLRGLRSTRFFGEKGWGNNEELAVVPVGTNRQEFVRVEKIWKEIEGRLVLHSVVAHTHPPTVWSNPYADRPIHDEDQLATDLCLRSLLEAVRNGQAPGYGARQARRDQTVITAILHSIQRGGEPVIPQRLAS